LQGESKWAGKVQELEHFLLRVASKKLHYLDEVGAVLLSSVSMEQQLYAYTRAKLTLLISFRQPFEGPPFSYPI